MPSSGNQTRHKPGLLFIIGGAEEREGGDLNVLKRFVEVAGGRKARILVCAPATTKPDEILGIYDRTFNALDIKELVLAKMHTLEDVERDEWLEVLGRATAVFMTGGDQLRITTSIGGTEFYSMLKKRHEEGLLVGGTSAGAAALSSTMIIGGTGSTVSRSYVQLAPGLEFLAEAVVDTHFNREGRPHRLMAVVAHNPATLGLGINEDTALIVTPGKRFEVVGSGVVTVMDGRHAETNAAEAGNEDPLAIVGLKIHILPEGYAYDLEKHEVVRPVS